MVALMGSACSDEPVKAPEASTGDEHAEWASRAGFHRADTCPEVPPSQAVVPGTRVVTAFHQGDAEASRTVHTAREIDDDTVWSSDVLTFTGDPRALEDDNLFGLALGFIDAGFKPASGADGSYRIHRYPRDLATRVAALRAGETTTFRSTEDTKLGGIAKSTTGDTSISLLGCGRLELLSGRVEPVHVYRIRSFHRAYRDGDPPTDIVQRGDSLAWVSDQSGRRLLTGRGSTWVHTLSIEPPAGSQQ